LELPIMRQDHLSFRSLGKAALCLGLIHPLTHDKNKSADNGQDEHPSPKEQGKGKRPPDTFKSHAMIDHQDNHACNVTSVRKEINS